MQATCRRRLFSEPVTQRSPNREGRTSFPPDQFVPPWSSGQGRRAFNPEVAGSNPDLFGDERGEVFVLFNGYGYSTHEMALLLANIVAGSARKIKLSNNGYRGGLVYINNCGYLIGNPETIHAMDDYYDLGWSVSGYSQYYRV